MSELKLNFKASNIAKAEEKYKKNFFRAMSGVSETPSFADLLFLFTAGGATEEQFDEVFSEGLEFAMIKITEGLNDSGFLGKKIDTEELKKAIEKQKN